MLLLTGFGDRELIQRAKEAGVIGYLMKPITETGPSTTVDAAPEAGVAGSTRPRPSPPGGSRVLAWVGPAVPLAVAALLNLWNLGQNGYGYLYYSVAVQSMMQSWSNFWFGAYDAGGFISLDKPPVSPWLQVLSAKLFGFTGLALLVPEALAGVAMVGLLYYLVRRVWGPLAGCAAALALALTPIAVAVNRENGVDTWLTLVLLLATWPMTLAAERGRLVPLLGGLALVGVAFNIKMGEAWIVLPAFYLLYLLAAPIPFRRRLGHLALGTVVLVLVSLPWVVAVDLTPAAARPWVGGTQHNSAVELTLQYNGVARLTGDDGGPNAGARAFNQAPSNPPPGGRGPGGPPGGRGPGPIPSVSLFNRSGLFGAGYPGPLRLLTDEMVNQWGWLLPLAVAGLITAVLSRRRLWPQALLWGGWLLVYGVVFSTVQGLFHPYYLIVLAPAAAALVGIGVSGLWRAYRRGGWAALFLPLTLLLAAGWQIYILAPFPAWSAGLVPVVLAGCAVAAGGLLALRWRPNALPGGAAVLLGGGLAALLVAPLAWCVPVLVAQPINASLPLAGPDARDQVDTSAWTGLDDPRNDSLIAYLQAHRAGAYYLLAVSNAQQASALTLRSGAPVLAAAGFMGTDPPLTGPRLADLVARRQVRYVYGLVGGGMIGGSTAGPWISAHCLSVPALAYGGAALAHGMNVGQGVLYDCGIAAP